MSDSSTDTTHLQLAESETRTTDEPIIEALYPRHNPPSSISVVVPCYNEEDVLDELQSRLSATLSSIGLPYEIILVDDGSSDTTWSLLCGIRKRNPHFKIIRLSRNYGHQIALTCGLDAAKGEVVLSMDADLQDPPELLPEMIAKWQEGYDVVYGKRLRREGESRRKRILSYAFYRLVTRITKIEIPEDTGDFRLFDRRALDALLSMRETHRYIRGMVSWVGLQQAPVYYQRPGRFAGETKYPWSKLFLLAADAITSFSYAPLRLATYLGAIVSVFAFLYIFFVIGLKIAGINFRGYTSLMGSILLLGGVQLMVLGIIGEYVGRIFEQGQKRPLYLIDRIHGEPLRGSSAEASRSESQGLHSADIRNVANQD